MSDSLKISREHAVSSWQDAPNGRGIHRASMLRRMLRGRLAGTIAAAFLGGFAATASSQALLEDGFENDATDVSRTTWSTVEGDAATFGRTTIMNPLSTPDGRGRIPVHDGAADLRLCRYNPTSLESNRNFWGSEIDSTELFALPDDGDGLEISALVRLPAAAPRGIVMSLFLYALTGTPDPQARDEIDLEMLTNLYPDGAGTMQVLLNRYVGESTGEGRPVVVDAPGLRPGELARIAIRWFAGQIHWLVNGKVIHTETSDVPTSPMGVRLNIWAPGPELSLAFDGGIEPASSEDDDECWIYEVHDVQLRRISGSTLLSSSPDTPSVGIPVDMPIELRFNDSMDTTACEGAIHLADDYDNDIPLDLIGWSETSHPDDTVQLAPSSPLDYAMGYRLDVDESCARAGGGALEPVRLLFGTEGGPLAGLPLQIVDTSPPAGGRLHEDVPRIVIHFDRPLDPQTVGMDTVHLSGPGRPSFEVDSSSSLSSIVVTPQKRLAANRRYRLDLDQELADSDGNRLGEPWRLEFRTPNAARSRPQVTLTLPADGGVVAGDTRQPVIVAFSESISPDTVRPGTVFVFDETAQVGIPLELETRGLGDEGRHSRLVIRPASGETWSKDHDYTITVSRSVTDLSVNRLRSSVAVTVHGVNAAAAPPVVDAWDGYVRRRSDGSIALAVQVDASRPVEAGAGAAPLEVSLSEPGAAGGPWPLVDSGGGAFEYLSPGNVDEGLLPGPHELALRVADPENGTEVELPIRVLVFDSGPVTGHPVDGATFISATPELRFRVPSTLDAERYVVRVTEASSGKTVFSQQIDATPGEADYMVRVPPIRALSAVADYLWWASALDGPLWAQGIADGEVHAFTTGAAGAPALVRIVAPADGETVTAGLVAEAITEPGASPVASVGFTLSGSETRTCTDDAAKAPGAPYSCAIDIASLDETASYRLVATATDADARTTDSAPITVRISNPDLSPLLGRTKLPAARCSGDGTKYTIPLKIENLGSARVPGKAGIVIEARLTGEADGMTYHTWSSDLVKVGGLRSGRRKSVIIRPTLPPGIPAGSYRFVVNVDGTELLAEASEVNNEVSTETFEVCEGFQDLAGAFAKTKVAENVVAGQGERGNVTVEVENLGNIPLARGERIAIALLLRPEVGGDDVAVGALEHESISGLKPDKSKRYTGRFEVPGTVPEGCYQLVGHIDAGNEVDEVDETNNEISGSRICVAAPFLDLAGSFSKVKVAENVVAGQGERGNVTVDVQNLGNIPVAGGERVTIALRLRPEGGGDDVTVGALERNSISRLKPGARKRHSGRFEVPGTVPEGCYRLVGQIDSDGQIDESDEGNNEISGPGICVAEPFVNLVAEVSPSATLPELVSAGDGNTFTVPVRVRNEGNVPVDRGTVIQIQPVVVPAAPEGSDAAATSLNIGGLAPGKTKEAKVKASIGGGLDGDAAIEFRVDSANAVAESAEDDNTAVSASLRVVDSFLKLTRIDRDGEVSHFRDPAFPSDVATVDMSDVGGGCFEMVITFPGGTAFDGFTFCRQAGGVAITRRNGGDDFVGDGEFLTSGLIVEQEPMLLGHAQTDTAPITGQLRLSSICTVNLLGGTASAHLELLGYDTVKVPLGTFATAKFRLKLAYEKISGNCGGVLLDEITHVEDFVLWAHPDVGIVKTDVKTTDKVCARAAGAGCETDHARVKGVRIP